MNGNTYKLLKALEVLLPLALAVVSSKVAKYDAHKMIEEELANMFKK